jgi:hypothetical protein
MNEMQLPLAKTKPGRITLMALRLTLLRWLGASLLLLAAFPHAMLAFFAI